MTQEKFKRAVMWLVAVTFSGVALIPHMARAAADDMQGAADTIATHIEYWDQLRQLCAETIPDEKRGLAAVYFHWMDKNRTEILGMRAWRLTQANPSNFADAARARASAQLVPIQQFNADQRRSVCVGAFRSLGEGSKDLIRKSPAQSALLTDFLKQHPLTEQQAREYDNPLGCAKRAVDLGGDLDRARPFCQCNWQATSESWSSSEWHDFEAGAANGRSAKEIAELPQVRRVASKLAACATKYPVVSR
jgi:hypothetical protein